MRVTHAETGLTAGNVTLVLIGEVLFALSVWAWAGRSRGARWWVGRPLGAQLMIGVVPGLALVALPIAIMTIAGLSLAPVLVPVILLGVLL